MRRLSAILVLAGLAISAYLLHRHFAAAEGAAPGVCSLVLHLDCDAALRSAWSVVLGIPLAGWGLIHFGTLGTLLLLAVPVGEPFTTVARRAAAVLGLAAAAASAVLLVATVAGAAPFCPLCATVHAANLVLAPLLVRASGRPFGTLASDVAAGFSALLRPQPDPAVRLAMVATLAAALVGALLHQTVLVLTVQHRGDEPDPRIALATWASSIRVGMPVDPAAPRFGPDAAPIRLVVFSDFECSACKAFAPNLQKLVRAWGGAVSAEFRHFPGSTSCNRLMTRDLHPHACAAACAAEAARRQGKFAEYHDALFAAQGPLDDDALRRAAEQAGLDLARFDADRNGPDARQRVADDVDLGIRLGVDETPVVFVNGRRVPDVRPAVLQLVLIAEQAERPLAMKLGANQGETPPK
jgi:protein-disulfide isomerase/uncharacterized membrane protein